MALKTNYKDDVLDLTQNANRKYEEIENQDGSISFNDVTVYEETGDTYGATDINETNTVVNSHNSALQVGTNETDLIRFAKDGNGNYGYKKVGSETFYPFQTKHTETYRPTSRANNLDMGEYHKKRYVDTTAVPNINSSTYSVTSNGTKDMGAANTYRYVSVDVGVSNYQTYTNIETTNQRDYDSQELPAGRYSVFYFNSFAGTDTSYVGRDASISLTSPSGNYIDYNQQLSNVGDLLFGCSTYHAIVRLTTASKIRFHFSCQADMVRVMQYGFIIHKVN